MILDIALEITAGVAGWGFGYLEDAGREVRRQIQGYVVAPAVYVTDAVVQTIIFPPLFAVLGGMAKFNDGYAVQPKSRY